MRNNALSLATRADTPLERGFLKPWIDRLHQHDVVVLNTGTSATGAPAEIAEVISRAVDHALANTPLTTTIVYRDTPFGHDRTRAASRSNRTPPPRSGSNAIPDRRGTTGPTSQK